MTEDGLHELAPPLKGATNNSGYGSHPPGTVPLEGLRNVVPHPGLTDRRRIGQGPGLRKLFSRQLANGPVQAVVAVSRATQIVGLTRGECRELPDGVAKEAENIAGTGFVLDDVPSSYREVNPDITLGGGGHGTFSAAPATAGVCCTADPRGEFFVYCINYTETAGKANLALVLTNDKGEQLDLIAFNFSPNDRSANTINFDPFGTSIAVATLGESLHLTIDRSAGQIGRSIANLVTTRWEQECLRVLFWFDTATNITYMWRVFDGSTASGVYDFGGVSGAGTITNGEYARQFRAGAALYTFNPTTLIANQITLPAAGQLEPLDDFFDSTAGNAQPHNYWRLSERMSTSPRGRRIQDAAVDPRNGALYIVTTNQGCGPNTTYEPDGSTPYFNLIKLQRNGDLVYEKSITPILEPGFGGMPAFINDILDPGFLACVADENGDLYVGGRKNAATALSVLKIRADTGEIIWGRNVMDSTRSVRQGAMSIDPSTGNVWVAGDQNSGWSGSGEHAHLWELNALNGSIVNHFQIEHPSVTPPAKSGLGIACGQNGRRLLVTDAYP